MERSLGVTVLGLIASEVPDDQGLVSGSRQEHVGAEERLAGRVRITAYLQSLTYFSMEVARLVTQPFC